MAKKDLTERRFLLNKIKEIEDYPGVYLMKDNRGRIIYIGKAKSLRKRIQSYWSGERDVKTIALLDRVADLEVIITRNEAEALLTEISLIKKWQPKYNINLKDGKTFPVIRVTNEPFPRIFRTRRIVFDGSRYFGPFPSVDDLDVYLHLVEKLYPLRKCRGPIRKKNQPCMYYHIGRCPGPCAGKISKEDYGKRIEKVIKLLEGVTDALVRELNEKMNEAAGNLFYEKAALYRDQRDALIRLAETKKLTPRQPSEDYVGLAVKDHFGSFVVIRIREGTLVNKEVFHVQLYSSQEEALAQFLYQYYSHREILPKVVHIPFPLDPETASVFLKSLDFSLPLALPEGEREKSAMQMALANAEQERNISHIDGLVELKNVLGLEALPLRIEGFDIAHLSGTHTVASLVSFQNGRPDKTGYRRFKIKSRQSADDYEAIRQVVARRYMRLVNEHETAPDLILIDGGKGQLESARMILASLDLEKIPVIGLAKKQEEIYIPEKSAPLVLAHTSPALRILVAVRDESHRFATSFHKLLRDREVAASALEKIKGIGKSKAKLLLAHFRSLENICEADVPEIAKIGCVKAETALLIVKQVKELLGDV